MGHPDQPYVNVRVQSAAFPRLATGNSTNKKTVSLLTHPRLFCIYKMATFVLACF